MTNCGRCGAEVPPGNRFCNACGAAAASAANGATTVALGRAVPTGGRGPFGPATRPVGEARLAARENGADAEERVIFAVRPSFLFVGIRYAVASLLWIASSALVAWIAASFDFSMGTGLLVVLALGLMLFVGPVVAHVRRQRLLYTLTNYKLELQTGLFAKTTRNVPLSKVQDVTVTWSVLKRLVGVGDIVIDTASEAGAVAVRAIPDPKRHADILLRELQRWN